MKIQCTWNEKLKFTAQAGSHQVMMDTKLPLGSDSALSPKQLLLSSIAGCTAMDVVSLLKKYKQELTALDIEVEGTLVEGRHPAIFSRIQLLFKMTGPLSVDKALEAVQLSQSKFCGVSAMVAKAVPIHYTVELNGEQVGEGFADFP